RGAVSRRVMRALAVLLRRRAGTRRPGVAYPLPRWWRPAAAVVAVGLLLTPGLSGHAGTGDLVPLAIIADVAHLSGVSLWLGGLVVLLVVVLRRKHLDELREVVPRYSRLALAAISVIIVSGAFQAWRQLGSLSNLRDT